MRRIASRHNPIVERFRAAARRDSDELVLLDGPHLVADALAAGLRFRDAAATPEAAEKPEVAHLLARLSTAQVDVVLAAAPVMAALSPVRTPSGIVAIAERPSRAEAMFAMQPLLLVACGVQDPGNVGAIVRVAEAAGATGVVIAGGSADPFGWKALRGSMGSALRLPIDLHKDGDVTGDLRRRGCRVVAASPRDGRMMFDADLTGPIALLIGGEGRGLSDAVVSAADDVVTIPMCAPVESLNAAVTAALLLYEARRQRT